MLEDREADLRLPEDNRQEMYGGRLEGTTLSLSLSQTESMGIV